MNLRPLEVKLLTAGRRAAVSDAVPYAFEKRIMARLADAPPIDLRLLWAQALSRAAATCVAITMLCGAWSLYFHHATGTDLAQDFERTVLVALDQDQPLD